MKKIILFIGLITVSLVSCSKEDDQSFENRIIGKWNLKSTTQLKNSQTLNLGYENATFEFTNQTVTIKEDTYLNKNGTYVYKIENENYFDSTLIEPKNTVLKIGEHKYILEIEYGNRRMHLTNYSDGKIYLNFEK